MVIIPRIILKIKPLIRTSFSSVYKTHIQAYIYELLKNSPYNVLHQTKKYKFFTFSDILPAMEEYSTEKEYFFFISSPDINFIDVLKEKINEISVIFLGPLKAEIEIKRIIKRYPKNIRFISASPVIIANNNTYMSFYHGTNLNKYLELLHKNAVDKYKTYYNEDLEIKGNIFDKMIMKKSVSILIQEKGKKYNIVGTMWKLLEKRIITKNERKFYNFIFDTGIGIKNSLGFGALNPNNTPYTH